MSECACVRVRVCSCVCVCVCACVCVCVCIGLDFAEFQRGMKEVCAHIHLTRDDFDIITENGKVRIPVMSPLVVSYIRYTGALTFEIFWQAPHQDRRV